MAEQTFRTSEGIIRGTPWTPERVYDSLCFSWGENLEMLSDSLGVLWTTPLAGKKSRITNSEGITQDFRIPQTWEGFVVTRSNHLTSLSLGLLTCKMRVILEQTRLFL